MSEREQKVPKPGDFISGRYLLQELIGEGSSALVFRATDEALGRDVAVKVLRDAFATSEQATARFRAEGRAAAVIAHPNVAAVFDVTPEGEPPAIVMEFVDGEDLASMVRRVGPLVPRRAAAIAAQVARGLAAAHVRGIIHRDVSSRNILISREGRAQIADFGIARVLHDAAATAANQAHQAIEGTPEYIAPEVAAGGQAAAASDVYGLGVVLYELLTGLRPTPAAAAPSALRPDIGRELDQIVAKMLSPQPTSRPTSTGAADALEAFVISANRTSVVARPVGPAAGAPRALAGTRVSRIAGRAGSGEPESLLADHERQQETDDDEPLSTRGMLLTVGGMALVALLLVGGMILALRVINAGNKPDTNVKIPPITSLTLSEAIPIIESAGLKIDVVERVTSDTQPVDTILSQSPQAGNLVPTGTVIEVRVVIGSGLSIVPDTRGMNKVDAIAALKAAGLRVGSIYSVWSIDVAIDLVVQENPRPGLQVVGGTAVDLTISLGPEPSITPTPSGSSSPALVSVPALRCSTVTAAQATLVVLGLSLDSSSLALSGDAIIDTYTPGAGEMLASGGTVSILTWSPNGTPLSGCP
ncbi:MAG: hypothetical protein RIQ87_440 [Chloroflexota bacterium]|jgi:serine/threonine-protein kinase